MKQVATAAIVALACVPCSLAAKQASPPGQVHTEVYFTDNPTKVEACSDQKTTLNRVIRVRVRIPHFSSGDRKVKHAPRVYANDDDEENASTSLDQTTGIPQGTRYDVDFSKTSETKIPLGKYNLMKIILVDDRLEFPQSITNAIQKESGHDEICDLSALSMTIGATPHPYLSFKVQYMSVTTISPYNITVLVKDDDDPTLKTPITLDPKVKNVP